MARRPSMSTVGSVSVAIIAIVGGWSFLSGTVVPALDTLRYGFPVYYTSSRLVVDGEWSPDVYDNAWFFARSLELTDGRIGEIYRPNTPVASLLAIPIAPLDIEAARRIWLVADLALIVVAIVVLIAALPVLRSPPRIVAVIALFLWWAPLRETVSLGQAYALMLALQAVALWAVVGGRATTAGLAVGAAVAAKLAAVPLFLLLAVRGSVRSVAVALGTAIVLAGLTVGFAGLDGWTRFLGVLGDDVLRPPPSVAVTAFQSATGVLSHLFAPDPRWNPDAVAALPALAGAGALLATGVVLGLTLWLGRDGRADVAVGAAITAGVLVVNLTQEHHFAMLLVPAVVSLARWLESPERRVLDVVWLALAFLLLAAPLAYKDPLLADGWIALLAYPRLYGAWLLWAWLIRELWFDRLARVADPDRTPSRTSHEGAVAR
jgi:hypothetical protein